MKNNVRYRLFGFSLLIGGIFLLAQTSSHFVNWFYDKFFGKDLWIFDPIFVIIGFVGLLLVAWGLMIITISIETLRTIAYQKRIDDYN